MAVCVCVCAQSVETEGTATPGTAPALPHVPWAGPGPCGAFPLRPPCTVRAPHWEREQSVTPIWFSRITTVGTGDRGSNVSPRINATRPLPRPDGFNASDRGALAPHPGTLQGGVGPAPFSVLSCQRRISLQACSVGFLCVHKEFKRHVREVQYIQILMPMSIYGLILLFKLLAALLQYFVLHCLTSIALCIFIFILFSFACLAPFLSKACIFLCPHYLPIARSFWMLHQP